MSKRVTKKTWRRWPRLWKWANKKKAKIRGNEKQTLRTRILWWWHFPSWASWWGRLRNQSRTKRMSWGTWNQHSLYPRALCKWLNYTSWTTHVFNMSSESLNPKEHISDSDWTWVWSFQWYPNNLAKKVTKEPENRFSYSSLHFVLKGGPWIQRCKIWQSKPPFPIQKFTNLYLLPFLSSNVPYFPQKRIGWLRCRKFDQNYNKCKKRIYTTSLSNDIWKIKMTTMLRKKAQNSVTQQYRLQGEI